MFSYIFTAFKFVSAKRLFLVAMVLNVNIIQYKNIESSGEKKEYAFLSLYLYFYLMFQRKLYTLLQMQLFKGNNY